ncbi:MAG: CZB domain-containing protein [Sulfuricurvum sp.]|nr:CZB domain-containing protein [Sulfuricurvum sp.]
MFKSNAYKSIANGKNEGHFADHHSCRLGKWYDSGSGKERFSHLPSYKEIETPHSAVHHAVLHNLQFIEEEDHTIEHKNEIIKDFKAMEEASQKLFSLMDNLIKESEDDLSRRS